MVSSLGFIEVVREYISAYSGEGSFLSVSDLGLRDFEGNLHYSDTGKYVAPRKKYCSAFRLQIKGKIPSLRSVDFLDAGVEYGDKILGEDDKGVLRFMNPVYKKRYRHPDVSMLFDLNHEVVEEAYISTIAGFRFPEIQEMSSKISYYRLNPRILVCGGLSYTLDEGVECFFDSIFEGLYVEEETKARRKAERRFL